MRVDFHTHIIAPEFPDFTNKYGSERWPVLRKTCSCGGSIYVSGKNFRDVTNQVWSPERRIEDMLHDGVDVQVLSPIPVTFSYWAPPNEALLLARVQNDFIAGVVRDYPGRFAGLGTVPLQDIDTSIREMDRCVHELGLQGIEIGSNVNGVNLDDEAFIPFFEMAEMWDVPIFVHPWETLGRERLGKHNLMYTVGMPSETALAGASILWSGLLEKHPGLKICLAHGGGSFPYILARLDQGWHVWPHLRKTEHPPSSYANKFYFDSLVYEPRNLTFMMNLFGYQRILLGSDYPFLLRETPPGRILSQLQISEEQREAVLGKNAAAFLGLLVKE